MEKWKLFPETKANKTLNVLKMLTYKAMKCLMLMKNWKMKRLMLHPLALSLHHFVVSTLYDSIRISLYENSIRFSASCMNMQRRQYLSTCNRIWKKLKLLK
jgi:hypothetical protein